MCRIQINPDFIETCVNFINLWIVVAYLKCNNPRLTLPKLHLIFYPTLPQNSGNLNRTFTSSRSACSQHHLPLITGGENRTPQPCPWDGIRVLLITEALAPQNTKSHHIVVKGLAFYCYKANSHKHGDFSKVYLYLLERQLQRKGKREISSTGSLPNDPQGWARPKSEGRSFFRVSKDLACLFLPIYIGTPAGGWIRNRESMILNGTHTECQCCRQNTNLLSHNTMPT